MGYQVKILHIPYSTWKQIAQNGNLPAYHLVVETGEVVKAWCGTNVLLYSCLISSDDYSDWSSEFNDSTEVVSDDDAQAHILGIQNPPLQAKSSKYYEYVEVKPPEGKRLDTIGINFCDPRTWYQEAVQVTDETLSDSGDGLTFVPATSRVWIDVSHGRLSDEHLLSAYLPVMEVDDVEMVEDSPEENDNDYTIDYMTGAVTFNSSQSGKTVVAKSYWYENGSTFTLKPDSGKILTITSVEVQFSKDIELTDSCVFQPYVIGFPYGDPKIYKTMQDYINEAEGSYPEIPQMGGSSWRGMSQPVHIFRWPYKERAITELKSSLQMEIRVFLQNNTHFDGSGAIPTFYGKSEDE